MNAGRMKFRERQDFRKDVPDIGSVAQERIQPSIRTGVKPRTFLGESHILISNF